MAVGGRFGLRPFSIRAGLTGNPGTDFHRLYNFIQDLDQRQIRNAGFNNCLYLNWLDLVKYYIVFCSDYYLQSTRQWTFTSFSSQLKGHRPGLLDTSRYTSPNLTPLLIPALTSADCVLKNKYWNITFTETLTSV